MSHRAPRSAVGAPHVPGASGDRRTARQGSLAMCAAITAATGWLAAGCVPPHAAGEQDIADSPRTGADVTLRQDGVTADGLARQVQAARIDLAARTSLDPDSIQVAEARPVTWGSGALGCPQPGAFYTQALVPGCHILLEVDGQTFSYHASAEGEPFLCPPDRNEPPLGQSLPESQ